MDFWKMVIQKNNYSYAIKEESITIWKHNHSLKQYISFNCFSLQSRVKFNQFKKTIVESNIKEYDNINDIYGLARKYEIRATNGRKPKIIGKVAF